MSPLPLAVMYSFQRKIYNEQDEDEVDRKEDAGEDLEALEFR